MTTIREVAAKAGVSITTVSHVINHTRFVSAAVKYRVEAAMEELGYTPNALARSLRKGSTKTIGLIVPDNSNPFFAEMSRVIEDISYDKGYSVILCNSDNNADKEDAYLDVLIAKQVDGVLFISTAGSKKSLEKVLSKKIPLVIVDRVVSDIPAAVVIIDNQMGGYEAARHLIALGHTRIACVTGPSQLAPSSQRVSGYQQALKEAGIPVQKEFIITGDFGYKGGEAAVRILLQLPQPPSAIFFCNDIMAIGGMKALYHANIRVPEEISVVGFDDVSIASNVIPELTTVAQPLPELGSLSTNTLIHLMCKPAQDDFSSYVVLQPRLIIRNSTAPVIKA